MRLYRCFVSLFALFLLGTAAGLEQAEDPGADIADMPDLSNVPEDTAKDLREKLKAKMDQMPSEDRKGEFKRLFDKIKKMDGSKGKADFGDFAKRAREKKRERPKRGLGEKKSPLEWNNPFGKGKGESSKVVKAVGDEFEKAVAGTELALVEFFAPWCGHCKKLAPEFDKASNLLAPQGIVLIAVDATHADNKAIAAKFGVSGYPTLKVVKGGDLEKAVDFKGPRTAEGIANFMQRMKGGKMPSLNLGNEMEEPEDSKVVTLTNENFTQTLKSADLVLVEFYAPWCGHCKKLAPHYSEASVALAKNGIVLAKMDATVDAHKSMSRNFGAKGFPTLRIFKDKDVVQPFEYNGPRTADGIIKYMTDVQSGTVKLEASVKGGDRKLGEKFREGMKKLPGMEHLSEEQMGKMREAFKAVPKDLKPEDRKAEFERIRKEYGVETRKPKPFQ